MFDERLDEYENNSLIGEDVYDILDIFNSIEECILYINKETDKDIETIKPDFKEALEEYEYVNLIDDYVIVYDKYVVFRTGRVAIIEFY